MTTPNDLPAKWRREAQALLNAANGLLSTSSAAGLEREAAKICKYADELTRALSSAVPSNVVGYGEVIDGKLMQYSHAPNGAAVTPLCVAAQSVPVESLGRDADEQEMSAFEQWYVGNAPDFEANPIGTRQCSLMRKAWNAACYAHAAKARPTPASVADGLVLMPKALDDEMREVLTLMLTNCRSVEESYADLIRAANRDPPP